MMWNAGGTLSLQLGPTGDELVLTGALTKGTSGAYKLNLIDAGITQSSYTLATFASTTFAPTNFTLTLPAGYTGVLVETATSLSVNLTHAEQVIGEIDSGGTFTLNGNQPGGTSTQPIAGGGLTAGFTMNASLRMSDSIAPLDSGLATLTVTPMPEPGCAALLAFGSIALAGRRQRRRR